MVKKKVTVVMFHDDEMGGYSVIIPTIPRLATMGKDVAHSLAMAKECWEISIQEPADWNNYELGQACSERVAVGTIEADIHGRKKVTAVVFHDDECGGYVAVMPAFPRCTTQGDTVKHALARAKECLEWNLREPTDWNLFDLDNAYSDHVVVGAVEVDLPPRPEPAKLDADTTTFDAAFAVIAED